MYRNVAWTPLFPEFGLPFNGHLDPDNRWVKKAALIPWALVESEYRKQLSGSTTGCPALLARMAFGALLIKETLKISDEETVKQIQENPYLQFFVGLEGFQTEAPFDASMMVYFRKRFPVELMNRISEAMALKAMKKGEGESSQADDSRPKAAASAGGGTGDEPESAGAEANRIEANRAEANHTETNCTEVNHTEAKRKEENCIEKNRTEENHSKENRIERNCTEANHTEANPGEEKQPANQGKLLLDATCAPADIRYPTDLDLLNEAREKTEKIIDRLHEARPQRGKKPRTYRRKARKEYLAAIKRKNKTAAMLRKAIRKQLGYVGRNLASIAKLAQTVTLRTLKPSLYRALLVISELHRQQNEMYEARTKRIEDRLVSLWFPEVRPIKRGKAKAETEFGAKVHLSLVRGFAFAERMDWKNYNEGIGLKEAVERYRRRFGFYPESVHADKIYRNRANLDYCREHGIRLSGPRLGRPPQDESLRREQAKQARQDERDRVAIEGKFGEGKRRYGLRRIMAKLPGTSLTVIALNLLVMNLEKLYRLGMAKDFFVGLLAWWKRMEEASGRLGRTLGELAAVPRRRRDSWAMLTDHPLNSTPLLLRPLSSR